MPAVEEALPRFRAADTQVLGVSVDSIHSHANWAADLGGVSFPLLADFHPKGEVAQSLGHYLANAGITDRATVIVDKEGVVRYSESVTPAGKREVDDLVAAAEKVNENQPKGELHAATGLPAGTTLFVKSHCGPSRRALVALRNLRVGDGCAVRNVTDDPEAASELERTGGQGQAPCLVVDGRALYEAADIVSELAQRVCPLA